MPAAAQMRHAVRTVGAEVEYEEAPEDYEPQQQQQQAAAAATAGSSSSNSRQQQQQQQPGETQLEGIRDALRAGDVDKAFGRWCKWSEEMLREVPLRGGGHVEGTGR
eukprot:16447610-Heterocapsa_arctica.AAC.1